MTRSDRAVASLELLLVAPAVLFMAALFVRSVQPAELEPAHTARAVIQWYAGRPEVGLWLLLIALPLAALVTGGATLLRRWHEDTGLRAAAENAFIAARAHLAMIFVAAATLTAGGILAIVALHVLSD